MNENRHLQWRGDGRGPLAELLFYAMSGCSLRRLAGQGGQRWRAYLLLSLPIAACSATSSVEHSPAHFTAIDSAVVVEASREAVFERLTNRLQAAGFAIVEIDNGLKLIRISLTTDQPDAYIDCGRSRRTFEGALGEVEAFDYQPATSSSYKLTSYDGVPLEATRDVVLEAAATVRASPKEAMTEVSVDVSYGLRTTMRYHQLGMFGSPTDEVQTVIREIRFQTAEPGIGDEEVAFCMSNGKLEARILELAR